jgi:hypothetical protein
MNDRFRNERSRAGESHRVGPEPQAKNMDYLPARCDACGFVVLVAQSVRRIVLRPCPQCAAEVSIFPGAKHQETERELFEAISHLVHAGVQPGRAALLLEEVEELEASAPATFLEIVAGGIPALRERLCSSQSLTDSRRLVAILLTVLRARSAIRSRSGFAPVYPPEDQPYEEMRMEEKSAS